MQPENVLSVLSTGQDFDYVIFKVNNRFFFTFFKHNLKNRLP